MSLDFIAAKTRKEINGKQPIFYLTENNHHLLLSLAVPNYQFRIISKISDYYSDAIVLFDQLNDLKDELNTIISNNKNNYPELILFLNFIESAIAAENNIYVTAD